MLADPQSVVWAGTPSNYARIRQEPTQNTYSTPDGGALLITKQNKTATRFRREVRYVTNKVASDPISGLNKQLSASCYIVIDEPLAGFTDTELGFLVEGLKTWLTSANQAKIFAGEF